jgi:hypothetical protein
MCQRTFLLSLAERKQMPQSHQNTKFHQVNVYVSLSLCVFVAKKHQLETEFFNHTRR